jgi:hypothetical protein
MDPALNGVQGLLAKSYSDDVAGPPLHSFSCRRHSANPDESKYLYVLRIDVHASDEGAEHHDRRDGAFR